ncbi:MAG TPA: hypothetical protein VK116_04230, partial [Planctomycetota bacterium]|nr:hypothetical protein [Planctomycetota bacterium]
MNRFDLEDRPSPSRSRLRSLVVLLVTLRAGVALAEPPSIDRLVPQAVRPGEATEIVVRGKRLDGPVALWTSFASEVEAIASESRSNEARFRVRVSGDVAPHVGGVRVITSEGASDLVLCMVDDLPSVQARSSHGTRESALRIEPPVALDGETAGESSLWFELEAREGDELSFEVFAQRIGSELDPVLRLVDDQGRELAFSDDDPVSGADSRFRHRFARGGKCFLELRDITWRGGSSYRYRLRIGRFPIVGVPFPLAITAGA